MRYICCKQTDIHRCCWGGNNLNSNSHCGYKIIVVSWSKSKYLCLISKNDSMTSSGEISFLRASLIIVPFRPQGRLFRRAFSELLDSPFASHSQLPQSTCTYNIVILDPLARGEREGTPNGTINKHDRDTKANEEWLLVRACEKIC